MASIKELSEISEEPFPDEVIPHIDRDTLLYPIGKAFLEKFPQHYDTLSSFDAALESIKEVLKSVTIIDQFIPVDDNKSIRFRVNWENARIFSPNDLNSKQYTNNKFIKTPNEAIFNLTDYTAMMVLDMRYSYQVINTSIVEHYEDFHNTDMDETSVITDIIPDAYRVNIPIPIGSKYDSLRKYDLGTLIRTGEESEILKGYFIINALLRYVINIYKKPFNCPIVVKNNYDNQLSRAEAIYTKTFDYEDSHFIVGAMVLPKQNKGGRGGSQISVPDIGFSLQLGHPKLRSEVKKTKKLINFVPIRILFAAFGCKNDYEMIRYICPDLKDIALISTIRTACLQGAKHKEAYDNAGIDIIKDPNYIKPSEPLTQFVAKYIIGRNILSEETISRIRDISAGSDVSFRTFIVEQVNEILDANFMPGMGLLSNTNRDDAVCIELGLIVRKLYLIGTGIEPSQDKSALTNRRIRNCQQILFEFKGFQSKRNKEIIDAIKPAFQQRKDMSQISQLIHDKMIDIGKNISIQQSKSLINAMKGATKEQSKIRTDILNPKNSVFIHNLKRQIVISSDTRQQGATVSWEHRTIHPSELFFVCPTQTPEAGAQTGRYKTPSIYTYITLGSSGERAMSVIRANKNYIKSLTHELMDKFSQIYIIKVNGNIVGYAKEHDPVENLYDDLMTARRDGRIEEDSSVTLNHQLGTLTVWNDSGRIVSPFVVVKNVCKMTLKLSEDETKLSTAGIEYSTPFLNWLSDIASNVSYGTKEGIYDLGIKNGYIEYLDPEMAITNCNIAQHLKGFYESPHLFTHIALPNHIHGIVASNVPAISLNVGVRATYSTNHIKSAIGPSIRYPQLKYVGENNILTCPQVPLVRPCTFDHMHLGEVPYGQNVIVAFIQDMYNQEDSCIVNAASVESGLLEIDSITRIMDELKGNEEEYVVPEAKQYLQGNAISYSKLDPKTALPNNVGDLFYTNDVLIGKIKKVAKGKTNVSILNEKADGKYPPTAFPRPVRCVIKNATQGENKTSKMLETGQFRLPITGDKTNTEQAQKCTIGAILPPSKIPYSTCGLQPDIIFSPPSVFKRKTYGQLYVSILAKISALLACPIDCTVGATNRQTDEIIDLLHKLGLDDAGCEILFDPLTGRRFKSRIFFSNHYWERQAHLVENKLNIRNGGPKDESTGQPTRGRKRGGGLSFDRMSFDDQNAAGCMEIVRTSHLEQGSKIKVGFCQRCHNMMCYLHAESHEWICPNCGKHPDILIRYIPPASVLMMHVLNAAHVGIDYYSDENILNDKEIEVLFHQQ